jgi:hypothetical protein
VYGPVVKIIETMMVSEVMVKSIVEAFLGSLVDACAEVRCGD